VSAEHRGMAQTKGRVGTCQLHLWLMIQRVLSSKQGVQEGRHQPISNFDKPMPRSAALS
jgi:hypothetical protein